MSERYPGGFITKNAPQPTGGESGVADGIWTLEQALEYKQAGTWPIPVQPVYVEDVFSTYLYSGTGSSQTITNNIDLSGKGGLAWIKKRTFTVVGEHRLFDTARTANGGYLVTNSSDAQSGSGSNFSFNSTGFSADYGNSGETLVSWTFRKAEKFFDVVTYTGDNTSSKAISHNLGSVPGCVIVKRTDSTSHWFVWHRSTSGTPNNDYTLLNQTAATAVATNAWSSNAFTSTQFYVSNNLSTNVSGATYVAYLFAHDAGGFGLTGSDNVISCGSFTTDGSGNATVSLGYEPQWMITKASTQAENWYINDVMRGYYAPSQGAISGLSANTSNAESGTRAQYINATGFTVVGGLSASQTYIYIAIRRGPMKTPTTGTSVFAPVAVSSATSTGTQISNSFVVDAAIAAWRNGTAERGVNDRLRGISTTNPTSSGNPFLKTNTTGAETTPSNVIYQGDGKAAMLGRYFAGQGYNQIYWLWGRAPGFFDVVCYTGTGSARTVSHNLGAVPELMIVKNRSNGAPNWQSYHSALGNTQIVQINTTNAASTASTVWNNTTPTSSVFTVGTNAGVNTSSENYVAYLFASLSGVSKVGSYTGTGTTLQVNCGFTNGSRFVLIKRTDSTGDWYVWDSARGIVAGDDPYLLLNSTAAEVTNTDYVDTYSAGFEISSTAPAEINANGGTFIFLAIA